MGQGYNDKSLLNLKQAKDGKTQFSSDRQPSIQGKKKTNEIRKLMTAFGKVLAPQDLRDDEIVNHFLEENELAGTVNEVLVARLYARALYAGDLKAIKLILDVMTSSSKKKHKGLTINFITPPLQEPTEDLESDSWTATQSSEKTPIL